MSTLIGLIPKNPASSCHSAGGEGSLGNSRMPWSTTMHTLLSRCRLFFRPALTSAVIRTIRLGAVRIAGSTKSSEPAPRDTFAAFSVYHVPGVHRSPLFLGVHLRTHACPSTQPRNSSTSSVRGPAGMRHVPTRIVIGPLGTGIELRIEASVSAFSVDTPGLAHEVFSSTPSTSLVVHPPQ